MVPPQQPVIAVTMGDPAGIGPEVVAKYLVGPKKGEVILVVVGDQKILEDAARASHVHLDRLRVAARPQKEKFAADTVNLVPVKTGNYKEIKPGHANAVTGRIAMACVEKATDLVITQEVDAIVTAPIVKKAINDAGFYFLGHTDYFAHRTNTTKYAMCFVADGHRVALVTGHVPLRKVHSNVRLAAVRKTIVLLDGFLRSLGIGAPRLVVTGLNPHAGENGLLGTEEKTEIAPAVAACRAKGVDVDGPVSVEAAFAAHLDHKYDGIVAMYHDQGLPPLKVLGFHKPVNVTLGLPFVRTSVGHGAALDIAGRGVAKTDSLKNAVALAAQLARVRQHP